MLKKRILSIVLALTMLMVPGAYAAQPAKDDMRGVWVASVHNIDFPSEQGMTADQLKAEADTELDNIAAMGLNTVFLQVRPSADALYPSDLFPWSRYVSGTAGQAPDGSFDWAASGKYPWISAANPSYHGVKFTEAAGKAAFVTYIRAILLRDEGACISPFAAFLLLQVRKP